MSVFANSWLVLLLDAFCLTEVCWTKVLPDRSVLGWSYDWQKCVELRFCLTEVCWTEVMTNRSVFDWGYDTWKCFWQMPLQKTACLTVRSVFDWDFLTEAFAYGFVRQKCVLTEVLPKKNSFCCGISWKKCVCLRFGLTEVCLTEVCLTEVCLTDVLSDQSMCWLMFT